MSVSLASGAGEPLASRFAAERYLTGGVLRLVQAVGIGSLLAVRADFSLPEAADLLTRHLGFVLTDPVRLRMIRVLVDLLEECGCLRQGGDGRYSVVRGAFSDPAPLDRAFSPSPAGDGQAEFFDRCLAHVPAFLRGCPPLFDFDQASAGAWDRLLANDELARARGILARLVLPRDARPCEALVLCYGPGFDLVEIETRCPAARVTALDFTSAFFAAASGRLEAPERVAWPDPASWGGFGRPLPFGDGAFDVVTLTCAEPYIAAADRPFVFADLGRILRPGGHLGLLTHAYPDALRQAVPDEHVRRATYCHDFLESVCRGWCGFSEAAALRALFEDVGFRVDVVTHNSSIWRLSKPVAPAHGTFQVADRTRAGCAPPTMPPGGGR